METRTRAGSDRARLRSDEEELLEFMAGSDPDPDGTEAASPAFRERLREDLWRIVQRLYGGAAPDPDREPPAGSR